MEHEPKSFKKLLFTSRILTTAIDYIAVRRWPSGVVCPGCGATKVSFNAKRRTWKCGSHHPSASSLSRLERSMRTLRISLDSGLRQRGCFELQERREQLRDCARCKGHQKSAWFMLQRIRLANAGRFLRFQLAGEVEVDETFIGGKARNHARQ